MTRVIGLMVFVLFFLMMSIISVLIKGSQNKKGDVKLVFNQLNLIDESLKKKPKIKRQEISSKQYFKLFLPIAALAFLFSLIFFRSLMTAIFITLISGTMPYIVVANREKKMKRLLNYQLREALRALSCSIRAGSSIRNALTKTYEDLQRIYGESKNAPILNEFGIINYELDLMISIEEVLLNFEKRADLEDVSDFVNVTLMAKRQGGDTTKVIERVTTIISDRIEIEYEIATLVAGKKMEARLLTMLPIIMVLILSATSPKYMAPMYESALGKFFMVIASLMLVLNYFIGKKIIDIEV